MQGEGTFMRGRPQIIIGNSPSTLVYLSGSAFCHSWRNNKHHHTHHSPAQASFTGSNAIASERGPGASSALLAPSAPTLAQAGDATGCDSRRAIPPGGGPRALACANPPRVITAAACPTRVTCHTRL